jgi:hypothetical protein
MSVAGSGQTPELDDDGNGVGNEKSDGLLSSTFTTGVGIVLAGDEPHINHIAPDQTLSGESTATIWVDNIVTTGVIESVWAVVTPPESITKGSSCFPVRPTFDLMPNIEGRFERTCDAFQNTGTYHIAVYASDSEGGVSLARETTVYQSGEEEPVGPSCSASTPRTAETVPWSEVILLLLLAGTLSQCSAKKPEIRQ